MRRARRQAPTDVGGFLRLGLLGLAALGIAGTTVELVFLQHWGAGTQWLVWVGMLALGAGLVLLLLLRDRRAVLTVRVLCMVALVIAVLGVWFHTQENLGAGPLDRHYADTWDSLGTLERWWLAVSETVGPAPTLAPGSLAEIALALLLATVGLPTPAAKTETSAPG